MSDILMKGTEPIGQVSDITADNVEYSSGVSVKDKIDSLPVTAWALVYNGTAHSASGTTISTTSNRSISKYPCLAFTFLRNGIARDSIILPSDLFVSGINADLSFVGGDNQRRSITVEYVSDTSVKLTADRDNSDYILNMYALASSVAF